MTDVRELESTVREFLSCCRQPALHEPGEDLFPLVAGCHVLEERQGCLSLRVWDERRTLTRRLLRVIGRDRGRLELSTERFGKRVGSLTMIDRAAARNHDAPGRCVRQNFRERFRRMLFRHFPGMAISRLSVEADLAHSLSPAFPRALLENGGTVLAAIAAPPEASHPEGLLTFGLIWLDYLRRRGTRVYGLTLFVPQGREKAVCSRVRHLNATALSCHVYAYSNTREQLLDLADFGNVDTKLESERGAIDLPPLPPERHIESAILGAVETLDARLLPEPVYCQAGSLAAGQRGIMDLLAVDRAGRLTIIELKASEDIHLPLQALDYWIRVKWHLDRGEFTSRGYFPGIELKREPPRLILAAPALQFHPANETVLRFFDPTIEVERIGLSPGLRVMFRM